MSAPMCKVAWLTCAACGYEVASCKAMRICGSDVETISCDREVCRQESRRIHAYRVEQRKGFVPSAVLDPEQRP